MINKLIVLHKVLKHAHPGAVCIKALLNDGFIEYCGNRANLNTVSEAFAYRECEDICRTHYSAKEPAGVSLTKMEGKWYILENGTFQLYRAPRKMAFKRFYTAYPQICWINDDRHMYFAVVNKFGKRGTQLTGIPGEEPIQLICAEPDAYALTKSHKVYHKHGLHTQGWTCLDSIPPLKQLECLYKDPFILCGVTLDGLFWHSHASSALPIFNWKHFPEAMMWKGQAQ